MASTGAAHLPPLSRIPCTSKRSQFSKCGGHERKFRLALPSRHKDCQSFCSVHANLRPHATAHDEREWKPLQCAIGAPCPERITSWSSRIQDAYGEKAKKRSAQPSECCRQRGLPFRRSALKGVEFLGLCSGQRVSYLIQEGWLGREAVNVHPLSAELSRKWSSE